jgi:hypothetical protein
VLACVCGLGGLCVGEGGRGGAVVLPRHGEGRLRGLLSSGFSRHFCIRSYLRCRPYRNTRLSGPDEHAAHSMVFGWAREISSLVPVVAEKEVNPSQSPTSVRTWSRTTPSCNTPHRSPAVGGYSASSPPASSLRAPQDRDQP